MAAPGKTMTLALRAAACLLVAMASVEALQEDHIFGSDAVQPTFKLLGDRGCLTPDFDSSSLTEPVQKCEAKVKSADATDTDCSGAKLLAKFYNCIGNTVGTVDKSGSSFNRGVLEASTKSLTSDAGWNERASRALAACYAAAAPGLNARQMAVYTYACSEWSLFAGCDQQQALRGHLAADGMTRRAKFLAGACPLSPATISKTFGVVTNATRAKCGAGGTPGAAAAGSYSEEISKIVCLMEDYKKEDGSMDFAKLTASLQGAGADSSVTSQVVAVMEACKAGTGGATSAEDFVRCWAGMGVSSCIFAEANELAKQMPPTCVITLDGQ